MAIEYYDTYEMYDRDREAELEKLPKCTECREPIQDEDWHDIPGLGCICNMCLRKWEKFI